MKFASLLLIMVIFWNEGIAQQTKFIVDKNLSLYFPAPPDSSHMNGLRLFYVNTENISFQVSVSSSPISEIHNEADFNDVLEGIVSGLYENPKIKSFEKEDKDTSVGGAKGKFIRAYATKIPAQFESMYVFTTVQDSYGYIAQTLVQYNDDSTAEKIRSFFSGIQFSGIPYTRALEESTAYKIGYGLGKFLIFALIGFGIIWLIIKLAK
jgi:hypothetical protein